jgi:hypothetical protein
MKRCSKDCERRTETERRERKEWLETQKPLRKMSVKAYVQDPTVKGVVKVACWKALHRVKSYTLREKLTEDATKETLLRLLSEPILPATRRELAKFAQSVADSIHYQNSGLVLRADRPEESEYAESNPDDEEVGGGVPFWDDISLNGRCPDYRKRHEFEDGIIALIDSGAIKTIRRGEEPVQMWGGKKAAVHVEMGETPYEYAVRVAGVDTADYMCRYELTSYSHGNAHTDAERAKYYRCKRLVGFSIGPDFGARRSTTETSEELEPEKS